MLVDLARNDLGKVCEEGSVHVAEYMQVEEFSHVQHLVSKVQGTLDHGQGRHWTRSAPASRPAPSPGRRNRAPWRSSPSWREGPEGRTPDRSATSPSMATWTRPSPSAPPSSVRGHIRFQAGAGIVYDSDPTKEYHETEGKLGALKAALGRCPATGAQDMKVLIIDNYDSFVYNLKQIPGRAGGPLPGDAQ